MAVEVLKVDGKGWRGQIGEGGELRVLAPQKEMESNRRNKPFINGQEVKDSEKL